MPNNRDITINQQVKNIAELLLANNKKLAVAESCTGGWIAKVLTDLSGSSAWFERGFVTYSNQAKIEMLGVDVSTLDTSGAVSEATVREMATGALKNSHANYSLSVSGIAGPDGGSKEKPIGLVWFAWANVNDDMLHDVIKSESQVFKGDRESVRKQAVTHALTGLIKLLRNI